VNQVFSLCALRPRIFRVESDFNCDCWDQATEQGFLQGETCSVFARKNFQMKAEPEGGFFRQLGQFKDLISNNHQLVIPGSVLPGRPGMTAFSIECCLAEHRC
jgi:hypothetical protein